MNFVTLLTGLNDPKADVLKKEVSDLAGMLWTASNVFLRVALVLLVLQIFYAVLMFLNVATDIMQLLSLINAAIMILSIVGYSLSVLVITILKKDYLWTVLILLFGLSWLYKFLEGRKIKV